MRELFTNLAFGRTLRASTRARIVADDDRKKTLKQMTFTAVHTTPKYWLLGVRYFVTSGQILSGLACPSAKC